MPAIFLLLCLFPFEKKTLPPRKTRAEGTRDAKRGEAPEKEKEKEKQRKGRCLCSGRHLSFGSTFPLKKERVHFPASQKGRSPEENFCTALCFSFYSFKR